MGPSIGAKRLTLPPNNTKGAKLRAQFGGILALIFFAVLESIQVYAGSNIFDHGKVDLNGPNLAPYTRYLRLQELYKLPIGQGITLDPLFLQWGETPENSHRHLFSVTHVHQEPDKLTLELGGRYELVAAKENATLSRGDQILHTFDFSRILDEEVAEASGRIEQDPHQAETKLQARNLGKKHSHGKYPKNTPAGMPTTFFDAYCRYGCGGMAVTFPYYYRPFFGYGFPLVGTEALFPQGYGGYPAAEILASQGGGSLSQGVSSPTVAGGAPQDGAAQQNSGANVATLT